jgi:hypothetical protein
MILKQLPPLPLGINTGVLRSPGGSATVARTMAKTYRIYRVYNFPSLPDVAIFSGAIDDCCELIAASHRAQAK